MTYNFYNRAYKKIICEKHYWTLISEHRTQKPFIICRNCKQVEKLHWYSDSQQSEIINKLGVM